MVFTGRNRLLGTLIPKEFSKLLIAAPTAVSNWMTFRPPSKVYKKKNKKEKAWVRVGKQRVWGLFVFRQNLTYQTHYVLRQPWTNSYLHSQLLELWVYTNTPRKHRFYAPSCVSCVMLVLRKWFHRIREQTLVSQVFVSGSTYNFLFKFLNLSEQHVYFSVKNQELRKLIQDS